MLNSKQGQHNNFDFATIPHSHDDWKVLIWCLCLLSRKNFGVDQPLLSILLLSKSLSRENVFFPSDVIMSLLDTAKSRTLSSAQSILSLW